MQVATNHVERAEMILCPLVLTRNHDTEVLLLKGNGRISIPRLAIPRWQRTAPHLVAGVRKLLGVEAICRFGIPWTNSESHCFVLDVLNSNGMADGASWVEVADIDWADSESASAREHFYAAVQQALEYDRMESPVPFTKTGWSDEVTGWVQSELNASGLKLNGRWTQYNMGPWFSLVRYGTDGPPVWFKAVGEPNLREYSITAGLRELRSEYLPPVIALHQDWHGWLVFDADGKHLDEVFSLEFWKTAARSLAALQIESVAHSEALIEAGCEDLRLSKLRRHVEPLLGSVLNLMRVQPATPPRVLDAEDLGFIRTRLLAAIEELEALELPDTLGHSDFNPGNILVNEHRAVFIDWMQGHIGHPFLTFEYLLALLRRLHPDLESWHPSLRAAYGGAWKEICSERQMSRALELIPLIAPFAFAVSCGNWQLNPSHINPQLGKLVRSLARRMFAEAKSLDARKSLRSSMSFGPGCPAGPQSQTERR